MSTLTITRLSAAIAGAAAWVLILPGTGYASPPPAGDRVGHASFQGHVINLALGWQGAQSCLVFSAEDTRCFASHAEADALLGYSRLADPLYRQAGARTAAGVPACASGWLCLYENVDGGGRRLSFNDEYWHYLDDWGFNRKTSSWRNAQGTSDPGHLSLYNLSTPYNCPGQAYASRMGVYNDQAYAVWG